MYIYSISELGCVAVLADPSMVGAVEVWKQDVTNHLSEESTGHGRPWGCCISRSMWSPSQSHSLGSGLSWLLMSAQSFNGCLLSWPPEVTATTTTTGTIALGQDFYRNVAKLLQTFSKM